MSIKSLFDPFIDLLIFITNLIENLQQPNISDTKLQMQA
jgi:hypothetical protein